MIYSADQGPKASGLSNCGLKLGTKIHLLSFKVIYLEDFCHSNRKLTNTVRSCLRVSQKVGIKVSARVRT